MRFDHNMAALALAVATSGITASPMTIARQERDQLPDLDYFPKPKRGKGQNNRRGKGKSNPPKSRPNRLIISKRVRRKHRRSA